MDREDYLFGPVPSRRLGLSLGVDIVPLKVCTLDCIYCQLGRSSEKRIERTSYVEAELVLGELAEKLRDEVEADFITISGSGEPTLSLELGEIVRGIKEITEIPVAILTNGTLLSDRSVRADCEEADVVLPSLDAGDEGTFRKINRPHADISIEKLVSGLCTFRNEFKGQIWLEVFLVKGVNTSLASVLKIKSAIERVRPNKIQLNTSVRPTTEPTVRRVSSEELEAIAAKLGENCEVIADFSPKDRPCEVDMAGDIDGPHLKGVEERKESLLAMLRRRPCSLKDICSGLGIGGGEALKYIAQLQNEGVVRQQERGGVVFFKAE
ncbi:MAG: radical SAM protein [Planctomycetota bacterium]|jgi:wyosine [tRNA(Phe)-imidazoG37] synthetase (radical SAM superfamily)